MQHFKNLGYNSDIGLNAFFYPNEKDTVKLLSFLLEKIDHLEKS